MANKAIRFYPNKWLHNPNLRLCSSGARGLWIDLLCLMFPTGKFEYNKILPYYEISSLTGVSHDMVCTYIDELIDRGLIKFISDNKRNERLGKYIIESSIMQRAYDHSQKSAVHARKSKRWTNSDDTDKPVKTKPVRMSPSKESPKIEPPAQKINWWDTPSGWAREAQKQSLCRNPGESLYDFQVRASVRIGHGEYRNSLSAAQLAQIEAMTPKQ